VRTMKQISGIIGWVKKRKDALWNFL